MLLKEIASQPAVLEARLTDPDFDLSALHCDSRRADPKTGFLALKGQNTDGHLYLDFAREAGTPVLFVSNKDHFARLYSEQGPLAGLFLIEPGREALADLAGALAGHPSRSLSLMGVTGTNGKTTVIHLVSQILEAMGKSSALLGTLGSTLGGEVVSGFHTTPEAPDIQDFLHKCLQAGETRVAMEVSSHGIALERTRGLSFAAAAFTNITQDHLDFHGAMEPYLETKFRLFLENDAKKAVVNLDDPLGGLLTNRLGEQGRAADVLTFALEREAHLSLENLSAGKEGMTGTLRTEDHKAPFRLPLLGRFNLSNLLAAVGLLLATGEGLEPVAEAVSHCRGARGRVEKVPLDAPFTVVVDYAHTPDALKNLLRAILPREGAKMGVLFGCGGDRDREKRPLMGGIAENHADWVVVSTDNPRGEDPQLILRQIASGMTGAVPTFHIVDRREAIHALLDAGREGDLLVIAGKGDETYQEIDGVRHPFDDREVVREWARLHGIGILGEG